MTQSLTQSLTRSMQPIIERLGFDIALRLSSHFGGTRISISESPGADCPVARAVGAPAATALGEMLGTVWLEVPRCVSWLIARRNEEIIARALFGEPTPDLARRYSLTERHIRNILRDDGEPESTPAPQPDLFTEGSEP